ncbi:MAG: Wzz/FepE/Etk N-terminal domain-containing protein [Bacillota bacterium]|nr:Wzz/FepE/Etk N-terminal domain-containing protein [Bacillota bacterium]
MEITNYINIIKKRLLLIIFVTLTFTLISAIVSYFFIKPTYKANISVIIGKGETTTNTAVTENYNDLLMYQNSVKTYAALATSRKVADDVISKLNLNMDTATLISMISATPNANTEFLTLTVKAKDKETSVKIANQLAQSLKEVSQSIKKQDSVNLVDDAQLPTQPDSPKPKLNIVIAFFLGLMVSVGVVLLLEYLDNTVKTQEDIESLLGIPTIGLIPIIDKK